MQYVHTTNPTRYDRGKSVVQRAAQLLDKPLKAATLLRNMRTLNPPKQAWEIGAILATANNGDVDAAAQRLADGIRRGQLEDWGTPLDQPNLDAYQ